MKLDIKLIYSICKCILFYHYSYCIVTHRYACFRIKQTSPIFGDKEELDAVEQDENDIYDVEKNILQNITVKYGLIRFISII